MNTENKYSRQIGQLQYNLYAKADNHRRAMEKLAPIEATCIDEDVQRLRSKISEYLDNTTQYGGNSEQDRACFNRKLGELASSFEDVKQRKASQISGKNPLAQRLLEGSYLTFGEPGNKVSDEENRVRILSGVDCTVDFYGDRMKTEYAPGARSSGRYDEYYGFSKELQEKVANRTITKEEFMQALENQAKEYTGFKEEIEAVRDDIQNTPYQTEEQIEAKKPSNILRRLFEKRFSGKEE